MKILMISAEAEPFAKTGGLADAVSALGKTLTLTGHSVKFILPRYYQIDRNTLVTVKKSVLIKTGWTDVFVNFYMYSDPEIPGMEYYFVDYEPLFGRSGIYGDPSEPNYHDNPLRFNVLARAAFELCRLLNWTPDIMHCHDWSASLAPVFLKYIYKEEFHSTKSVLTIHNQGYQGSFPGGAYKLTGLPEELRMVCGIEMNTGLNFLKAGIQCADGITTVSETYAKEIQTAEYGCGLDGLLRVRGDRLTGIVNGADLTEWNPEVDRYIPARFTAKNLTGKAIDKKILQKRFGLEVNPEIPVVSIICRLAEQKGIRELFAPNYGCMYRLCTELKTQFIVVGSGEKWCQDEIQELSRKLPNLKNYIGYNEEISHLVEAGSDFFLMPSKYEPCGLNQIYSMLYGTLPIVHATGGLEDTVENSDGKGNGTGFKFYDLTPDAIFGTTKWALETFYNKEVLKKMQQNGMKKDFGWEKSAEKYVTFYKSL